MTDYQGIAAVLAALTGLLTAGGTAAWTVFRYWRGEQAKKERVREAKAKRAIAAKNAESRALKRLLAACEERRERG
jgi:hypothetical protein